MLRRGRIPRNVSKTRSPISIDVLPHPGDRSRSTSSLQRDAFHAIAANQRTNEYLTLYQNDGSDRRRDNDVHRRNSGHGDQDRIAHTLMGVGEGARCNAFNGRSFRPTSPIRGGWWPARHSDHPGSGDSDCLRAPIANRGDARRSAMHRYSNMKRFRPVHR